MEFGESSINFLVHYWTLPQKVQVRRVRTHVIIALKQACDRAGLNIPFPIRTIYVADQSLSHGNGKRPDLLTQVSDDLDA